MRNLKYAALFVITFAVVLATILLFQTKNTSGLKKAPDFTLNTFEGKKLTLSKLNQEKVVVINFWASWCGPCKAEARELESVWRKYKDKIYFLGLNYNDTEKGAKSFIKEYDVTYPNSPIDGQLARDYGITGIPETFIIKDGLIYDHIIGATTAQELSQKIEDVL